MSERSDNEPTVLAEDVWVNYLIRYHRSEVTLRETFVRMLDRLRHSESNGRWSQSFWPLRGISLTAYAGDVIGIIGPNGAGKSTLLKTLAGILSADRGRLTVRGRIGCLMSFGVGFNANLSGRENIIINGCLLGLSRRDVESRLDRIIEFSALGDFIDAPVRTYSAGMKGRLGFSIAIHIDPDVLLLDEVLTVGDASFRAKAGSILDRFRDEKKTVILASHSMPLIRERCTKTLWLERGEAKMFGDPAEVVHAYVTATQES